MIDVTQVCISEGGRKATRCKSAKERSQAHYTCHWAIQTGRDSGSLKQAFLVMESRGAVEVVRFPGNWAVCSPTALLSGTCTILDVPSTDFCWKSAGHLEAPDLLDKLIFDASRLFKPLGLRSRCAFDKSISYEFGNILLHGSLWESPWFLNK